MSTGHWAAVVTAKQFLRLAALMARFWAWIETKKRLQLRVNA